MEQALFEKGVIGGGGSLGGEENREEEEKEEGVKVDGGKGIHGRERGIVKLLA